MKRNLYLLASVLSTFVLAFALVSCNKDDETCKTHVFSSEYTVTENGHEYHCTNKGCDAVRVDSHYFGSTVTVTPPTCTEEGVGEKTCITCEYSYTVPVEMAQHIYEKTYTSDETNHWRKCENCDAKIAVTNHSFVSRGYDDENHWYTCVCGAIGNVAAHTWNDVHHDDGTITRTCTEPTCGLILSKVNDPDHVCNYTKGDVIKAATCTETGLQELVCVCGGKTTITLDMISHDFTYGEYTFDETHHWQSCACGETATEADKVPHSYDGEPVTEGQYNVYTCVCGHQKKELTGAYIDPDGWT